MGSVSYPLPHTTLIFSAPLRPGRGRSHFSFTPWPPSERIEEIRQEGDTFPHGGLNGQVNFFATPARNFRNHEEASHQFDSYLPLTTMIKLPFRILAVLLVFVLPSSPRQTRHHGTTVTAPPLGAC